MEGESTQGQLFLIRGKEGEGSHASECQLLETAGGETTLGLGPSLHQPL